MKISPTKLRQYKTAVDTLEAKLKDAYAGIKQQNETITNLVSQRDDLVKKLQRRGERPERCRRQI